ncbi:hypothetical protein GCM10009692_32470 [Leucobacter aridicollis]
MTLMCWAMVAPSLSRSQPMMSALLPRRTRAPRAAPTSMGVALGAHERSHGVVDNDPRTGEPASLWAKLSALLRFRQAGSP